MALDCACKATMAYWFPLRARGWKQPVSSVKSLLSRRFMSCTELAVVAVPGCGCVLLGGEAWSKYVGRVVPCGL